METKLRYKLKKVKKQWVTVAITAASLSGLLAFSAPVSANELVESDTPVTNSTESSQTVEATSPSISASEATSSSPASETVSADQNLATETSQEDPSADKQPQVSQEIAPASSSNVADSQEQGLTDSPSATTDNTQEGSTNQTPADDKEGTNQTTVSSVETDSQPLTADPTTKELTDLLLQNPNIKEVDGKYYYVQSDGSYQKNFALTIGKQTFYFDTVTGAVHDPRLHHFDQKGLTGFVKNDRGFSFYKEDGSQLKQEFYTNDRYDMYYFDQAGLMVTGHQTIDGQDYFFLDNGIALKNALHQNSDGTTNFFKPSGVRFSNDFRLFKKLDGKTEWRHFDQNGVMSLGQKEIKGLTIYFDDLGFITRKKWVDNITLADGTISRAYFNSAGILATNRFADDEQGKTYYLDEKGAPVKGYQTIDGKTYYFNSKGIQAKGFHKQGSGKIRYYSPETGVMLKDAYIADNEGNYYYFDRHGVGQLTQGNLKIKDTSLRGLQTIGNHRYYFDNQGQVVKGQWVTAEDGKTYYFEAGSGILATNRFIKKDKGTQYLDKDGQPLTGEQIINGKTYDFYGVSRLGSEYNYRMVTGFVTDSKNNSLRPRYFDSDTGELVTNRFAIYGRIGIFYWTYLGPDGWAPVGPTTIDGVTYDFRPDGRISREFTDRGYSYDGPFNHSDNTAYFLSTENQALVRNQWVTDAEGKTYYHDAQGKPMTGFQMIDGKGYYFHKDGNLAKGLFLGESEDRLARHRYFDEHTGQMLTNAFKELKFSYKGMHWFYFGPDGWTVTGDQVIDGKNYHFLRDGRQIRGEHVSDEGKLRFFDKDGVQVFNDFAEDSFGTYYLGADGYAVTGSPIINGEQYHFFGKYLVKRGQFILVETDRDATDFFIDPYTGTRPTNRFVSTYNNDTYYVDDKGHRVTGFLTIDGKTYYFRDQSYKNKLYGLQVKRTYDIDGVDYHFDTETGELLNP